MKANHRLRFLIVKTSSLGDIIQAMSVLNYLHDRFPEVSIDWIVEKRFATIVEAHPLVDRTISFDIKKLKSRWHERSYWKSLFTSYRELRRVRYDAVFDLQGNCKSGIVTFLSSAKEKVGFSRKCVREWPNVLATKKRYSVPFSINIRLQYVRLIQQFFNEPALQSSNLHRKASFANGLNDFSPVSLGGVRFKITPSDQTRLQQLLSLPLLQKKDRVMVCPGSKWINKQLPLETLAALMEKIECALQCSFLLVWGDDEEQRVCQAIQRRLSHCSVVIDRLELPLWQNVMNEVDLVIAVDSAALHLCGTTSTPSFSIFGPTLPAIFKPVGDTHFSYQGQCPYHKVFEKQCSMLRSCPTGACVRSIPADVLFDQFYSWWQKIV